MVFLFVMGAAPSILLARKGRGGSSSVPAVVRKLSCVKQFEWPVQGGGLWNVLVDAIGSSPAIQAVWVL